MGQYPPEYEAIHNKIKQELKEQVDSYPDKVGDNTSPEFRYAIDGMGNEFPLGAPSTVVQDDEHRGKIECYEFPIIESDYKAVIDFSGDCFEMLTSRMPTAGMLAEYVDDTIGDIIGHRNSGYVFFFNKVTLYWHVSGASIFPRSHDTEKHGASPAGPEDMLKE